MRRSYVSGGDRLRRRLLGVSAAAEGAVTETLKLAGADLKTRSQQLVPVDTGTLRDSAYATVDHGITGPELTVGYAADYAIYVHERLDVFHPVGGPKYLERPFNDQRARYIAMLEAGIIGGIRKRG